MARTTKKVPSSFIAVMGVTGAGKSSFVKAISGDRDVVVGHSLESCTTEIQTHSFMHEGRRVYLVDTPGFNDTHKSETQVLDEIADWLEETYDGGIKLSGIIYLHSIANTRMEGSALRNLKMFRKLCGDEPLKNVILCTTFWGEVDTATGTQREDELRTNRDFWGGMVSRGSRMVRFTDRQSGLDIVSTLFDKNPIVLEIQRELVDEGKDLIETAAGITVNEELLREEAKHAAEREKIQEEMRDALHQKDVELQEILEEQQEKLDKRLDRIHRQQEQLKARSRAERKEMELEMEQKLRAIELHSAEERKRFKEQMNAERRAEQRQMENGFDAKMRRMEGDFEERLRMQNLSFEQAVALVRANESKLNEEERKKLEVRIATLSNQIPEPKKKERKTGRMLMKSLGMIFPAATMALLGVPIPFPGGSIFDFVDNLVS